MRKAQPLPVIFLKAVRRGDTRTADLLGANPVLMPATHLETRTRQDGVTQTYHVSNAAPEKPLHFAALDLGLGLDTPAATADPLAGIAATDPRREHVHHLATVDLPRAQRAAALLAAMTRNDLGALGRLFGAMSLKEAEASSLDIGLAVPRVRSKQELLNYIQPELLAEIRKRQAAPQKSLPKALTVSANGSSFENDRGGTTQAPQPERPMNLLNENQEWVLRRFAEKRAKGQEIDLDKTWGQMPGYVARWAGFGEWLANPPRFYWNGGHFADDKNYVTFPREGPQFVPDRSYRSKVRKEEAIAGMKVDLDNARQEIKAFMDSGQFEVWLANYRPEV